MDFLTVNGISTPGAISYLTRDMVIVTREAVAGFSIDAESGMYKINAADLTAFIAANAGSLALIRDMTILFGQARTKDYVYILSVPTGVAIADLDQAYEADKRAWVFITYAEKYQYGGTGSDAGSQTAYLEDVTVIGGWLSDAKEKIFFHTLSLVLLADLPTEFLQTGIFGLNAWMKTIVSDSLVDAVTYDNIAQAIYGFCISDSRPARSWGSFSDAHDFSLVAADGYTAVDKAAYLDENLSLYNGDRDRAKSKFMFDTFMNSRPDDLQLETRLAMVDIQDAGYVDVRNALQAAGETGVPADQAGINRVAGELEKSLDNSFARGLILSNADLTPNYTLKVLSAAEVTSLSPTWQATGVWPTGVFEASVLPYGATHYITISFIF